MNENYVGMSTPKQEEVGRKEASVITESKHLQLAASLLHKSADELRNRLSHVLRSSPSLKEESAKTVLPILAPFAEHLRETRLEIAKSQEIVSQILGSLEI